MFLLSLELPKGPLPQAPSVILVAEDEVLVRNIVCALLHKEGYEVLSAADGEEALELAREYNGTIDLLLSDVKMPRMDGVSLAEHMIKERPGIRVLLMSVKPPVKFAREIFVCPLCASRSSQAYSAIRFATRSTAPQRSNKKSEVKADGRREYLVFAADEIGKKVSRGA